MHYGICNGIVFLDIGRLTISLHSHLTRRAWLFGTSLVAERTFFLGPITFYRRPSR